MAARISESDFEEKVLKSIVVKKLLRIGIN